MSHQLNRFLRPVVAVATHRSINYVKSGQSRIKHLVGPTNFTTLGPHWEARRRGRRDRDAEGVEGEGNGKGVFNPQLSYNTPGFLY